jgi:hypothetical protein
MLAKIFICIGFLIIKQLSIDFGSRKYSTIAFTWEVIRLQQLI